MPPANSEWEARPPVLFNAWKHHAGFLRRRIEEVGRIGEIALADMARQVRVIGTALMDLYTGSLPPRQIGEGALTQLDQARRLDAISFRNWLSESGGYAVLTLPDDSRWVIRSGVEADRYVHVHPARRSPATCRVRANELKTAVLILTWVSFHGGDPFDAAIVNRLRGDYLELPPVGKELNDAEGLGAVINLLRPAVSG
jgi:hypothetical protein